MCVGGGGEGVVLIFNFLTVVMKVKSCKYFICFY